MTTPTHKAHGFSRGSVRQKFDLRFDPRQGAWALPLLILVLVGCGSDGDVGTTPGVTAKFNGDDFAATTFMAAFDEASRSIDNGNRPEKPIEIDTLTGRFRLVAKAGDRRGNGEEPAREIILTVSGIDGPGTYQLIRGNQDIESFQLYGKDYAATPNNATSAPIEYYAPVGTTPMGTLVIDELGPDAVGTFAFIIPSADGDLLEIEDGK
ncbi:MAG: hypothetical protein AAF656_10950, partial [Planctomycetota bacterium]